MTEQPINPYAPPAFVEEDLVVAQQVWPLKPTEDADIQSVPDQYQGQTFTLSHLLMTNALEAIPFFFWITGGGLFVYTYFLGFGTNLVLSLSLIVLGVAIFMIGYYIAIWYSFFLGAVYSKWRFRSAVRNRHDSIVNPDDQEVIFVGLSQREDWKKIKLDTCHDIGLLKLNPTTSSIIIESDKERFQIPKNSLFLCEPEVFNHPADPYSEFWLIRLVFQTPEDPRELLIGLAHTDFMPRTNEVRHEKTNIFFKDLLATTVRNSIE